MTALDTRLYGRAWHIAVGDVLVSDNTQESLACEFTVKKTLKVEPNTCTLKIWNLNPATRDRLTSPKKSIVRIEAGYADRVSQIYLGEVRAIAPGTIQGPDVITELTSGDGEKQMQGAHLMLPMGAKTANGTALTAIAKALGVGLGNVPKLATALAGKGAAVFPRATVVTGNAARTLTDFCRSAGLEWSIQDGAIQILDLGAALEIHPYILGPDTGLIGAPTISNDGKVNCQTLMIPELRPGLRVQFNSFSVKGLYRILQCDYNGATHGPDWSIKLTCEAPKRSV